jgi:hypothetical protein
MTDRPIIFSAPMVRALLNGRKTQTRRIISADIPDGHFVEHCHFCASGWGLWERGPWASGGRCTCREVKGIRFREGDRLWVRENWTACGTGVWTIADARTWIASDQKLYFAADEGNPTYLKWWPSIHMPREFSRLTLVVTDVRVERLQDISEADVLAEGIDPLDNQFVSSFDRYERTGSGGGQCVEASEVRTRRPAFERLWNSINGTDAWGANPWVAAVSFTVHRANVDALDIGAAA